MRIPEVFYIADSCLGQQFGRGGVIVREYDHPDRGAYARGIIKAHRGKGPVLVAGDINLARQVGAQGLHVPEWQLAGLPRRLFKPRSWLITAACHNLKALVRARRHGLVDAALLSPLFATESHPDAAPLGVVRFGLLTRQAAGLRLIALGGLKLQHKMQLRCWGIRRIAMRSGAFPG